MKPLRLILPITLFILSGVLLSGCSKMTNEEIVKQTKYCTENGLKAEAIQGGAIAGITEIICFPKD